MRNVYFQRANFLIIDKIPGNEKYFEIVSTTSKSQPRESLCAEITNKLSMEEGGFLRETVDNEERSSPLPWRSNSTANVDVVPNFAKRVLPDEDRRNYSGCTKCSSLSFSQEFSDAFGVLLCATCRRKEKLISKVL